MLLKRNKRVELGDKAVPKDKPVGVRMTPETAARLVQLTDEYDASQSEIMTALINTVEMNPVFVIELAKIKAIRIDKRRKEHRPISKYAMLQKLASMSEAERLELQKVMFPKTNKNL